MAYLGHKPINPNHPFAKPQISFGQKRPNYSPTPSKPQKTEPTPPVKK